MLTQATVGHLRADYATEGRLTIERAAQQKLHARATQPARQHARAILANACGKGFVVAREGLPRHKHTTIGNKPRGADKLTGRRRSEPGNMLPLLLVS